MGVITAVEPKGEKAAILVMDDGSRIWTPDKAKADELVGKPIPSEWTQKVGDFGPQAFPPRAKGGTGGGGRAYVPKWVDTEIGARWQDGRINRRRALELAQQQSVAGDAKAVLTMAEKFLGFLIVDDITASSLAPSPSEGGGAERPSGGGGPATSGGKPAAPQPPTPTGHNDDCTHVFKPSNARKGWDRCELCGAYREAA
jgi:hypothetical protein